MSIKCHHCGCECDKTYIIPKPDYLKEKDDIYLCKKCYENQPDLPKWVEEDIDRECRFFREELNHLFYALMIKNFDEKGDETIEIFKEIVDKVDNVTQPYHVEHLIIFAYDFLSKLLKAYLDWIPKKEYDKLLNKFLNIADLKEKR